jgi:hypothetical protein
MSTELTVSVPDYLAAGLQSLADGAFRTPEGQVLWLIKMAVEASERRERPAAENSQTAYEQRLQAAQPVFDELRSVHLLAGGPASRVIAKAIFEKTHTKISHTTVNGVIGGTVAPSWPVLEKIVRVLGGDVGHFRQLWAAANTGRRQ